MGFIPASLSVKEIRYELDKRRERVLETVQKESSGQLMPSRAVYTFSNEHFRNWEFYSKEGHRTASLFLSMHKNREGWQLYGGLLMQARDKNGRMLPKDYYELSARGAHSQSAFNELVYLINGQNITPGGLRYLKEAEIKKLGNTDTPGTLDEVIEYISMLGLIDAPAPEPTAKQKLGVIYEEFLASVRSGRPARLSGEVSGHISNIYVNTESDPMYKPEANILTTNGTVYFCLPNKAPVTRQGSFNVFIPRHGEHLILTDADKKTGLATDIDIAYR